jgi:hypothetical protein
MAFRLLLAEDAGSISVWNKHCHSYFKSVSLLQK